jgi:hypothetical protein
MGEVGLKADPLKGQGILRVSAEAALQPIKARISRQELVYQARLQGQARAVTAGG